MIFIKVSYSDGVVIVQRVKMTLEEAEQFFLNRKYETFKCLSVVEVDGYDAV